LLYISANPLPHPISHATVVPIGDSFLVVGGETNLGETLDTIYHYIPHEDSWTLLDAKLKNGKGSVTAMTVPREMFEGTSTKKMKKACG
jgi:N-acetylneuraminic acid mutarotase